MCVKGIVRSSYRNREPYEQTSIMQCHKVSTAYSTWCSSPSSTIRMKVSLSLKRYNIFESNRELLVCCTVSHRVFSPGPCYHGPSGLLHWLLGTATAPGEGGSERSAHSTEGRPKSQGRGFSVQITFFWMQKIYTQHVWSGIVWSFFEGLVSTRTCVNLSGNSSTKFFYLLNFSNTCYHTWPPAISWSLPVQAAQKLGSSKLASEIVEMDIYQLQAEEMVDLSGLMIGLCNL